MEPDNHQRLAEWIMRTGRKRSWVSQQLGVTPGSVTLWCKGATKPSLTLAFRLQNLTDGEVKAEDW